MKASVPVLRVYPRLNRPSLEDADMLDGEAGDAEHVEPRCNRHRLPPMGHAGPITTVGFFDEYAVGHDLVMGGGGHDEFVGSLVIRMVDGWKPTPRTVRPIVAEESSVPILVWPNA